MSETAGYVPSLRTVITDHFLRATDEGGADLLDSESRENVFEVGYRLGFLNALQYVALGNPAEWAAVANEAARIEDD